MKRIVPFLFILSACLMASVPVSVNGIVSLADYPSLQDAVNAVPNGGTVVIPVGVWDIGTVDINANQLWNKVVTIQGVSVGYFPSSAARGSSEYDYLINGGYVYGSFLRGHLDATTAGAKLRLENIAIIGDGTGTAVHVGNGSVMFPDALDMEGVYIGNYETAIQVERGYYMDLQNVSIAGVDSGVVIYDSNAVRLSSIDIMTCVTGIDAHGDSITYADGSVQGCDTAIAWDVTAGNLSGVHFEQDDLAIELSGSGNQIQPNYYASNGGTVEIIGNNNIVTLGLNPSENVEISGSYNRVLGSAYFVCNDNGFGNICDRLFP